MHLKHEAASQNMTPRRDTDARLSFAQQRLWYLSQVEPDRPLYNVPTATRLSGPLDVDALRKSLAAIVERHDVLRTRFVVKNGMPIQKADVTTAADVPFVDLSGLAPDQRESELRSVLSRDAQRVFDLEHGPLWRAKILRMTADEHVLFCMPHHSVFDGRSFVVFWRELSAFYRRFTGSEHQAPPPVPRRYAQFAEWQRDRLEGGELEGQLSFWQTVLKGELPVLDLPTDRPRPPVQNFRGDTVRRTLPAAIATEVAAFARSRDAQPFMVVLAAYQLFLTRYSGQEDIIVGTATDDRVKSEHEGMIGMFANTLALRTSVDPRETFATFLDRIRRTVSEAFDHRDLPFERLVETLQPRRDPSRTPIFQAFLAFEDLSEHGWGLPNITCTRMPLSTGASRTDVTLFVRLWPEALELELEYSTELFDEETAQQNAARNRATSANRDGRTESTDGGTVEPHRVGAPRADSRRGAGSIGGGVDPRVGGRIGRAAPRIRRGGDRRRDAHLRGVVAAVGPARRTTEGPGRGSEESGRTLYGPLGGADGRPPRSSSVGRGVRADRPDISARPDRLHVGRRARLHLGHPGSAGAPAARGRRGDDPSR